MCRLSGLCRLPAGQMSRAARSPSPNTRAEADVWSRATNRPANRRELVTAEAALASRASPTVAALLYPSGDKVLKGYPVLVRSSKLDRRLASWLDTPKAVAVAPGVYAAYNPAVTDLSAYLELPNDGDCAVRHKYFPDTGGACWNGVLPGPDEP